METQQYTKGLLEMDYVRPQLDGVKFKESSYEDNTYLLEKFSLEEVKMVVWECGNDKYQGRMERGRRLFNHCRLFEPCSSLSSYLSLFFY